LNALQQLWDKVLPWLREIGISGLVDIFIVALVIYTFMVAVKRTQRSGLIFGGILIISLVYIASRKLDLKLTSTLLHGFFEVILVALVVIFQEDLRYFFERVALWWMERRLPLYKRQGARLPSKQVEVLARTLADLARAKIGALIVVRGKDVLARHLTGGEEVDGLLSEALLKSLFDPHSPGHDGAVILEGNRIARLGCHLPLSNRLDKLPGRGTRHAAGLGLAELSDALCLVVSEEQGTLSVARHGEIVIVPNSVQLMSLLENFYREVPPSGTRTPWRNFLRENFREKVAACALALFMWSAFVYRSQTISHSFEVPVTFNLLPSALAVNDCQPSDVLITLSGQRKAFNFVKPGDVKLVFNLLDAKTGRRILPVTQRELTFPEGLELEDVEPRHVQILVSQKPATNGAAKN
jgi:uncharacterized protein (TIGR00159 family)